MRLDDVLKELGFRAGDIEAANSGQHGRLRLKADVANNVLSFLHSVLKKLLCVRADTTLCRCLNTLTAVGSLGLRAYSGADGRRGVKSQSDLYVSLETSARVTSKQKLSAMLKENSWYTVSSA